MQKLQIITLNYIEVFKKFLQQNKKSVALKNIILYLNYYK